MSRISLSFVSGNAGKVAEVTQILKGIDSQSPNHVPFPRTHNHLPRQLVLPSRAPYPDIDDVFPFSSPTRPVCRPPLPQSPSPPRTPRHLPLSRKRKTAAVAVDNVSRQAAIFESFFGDSSTRLVIPLLQPGQVRLQKPPENVSDETMHLCSGLLLSSPELLIRYSSERYGMKVYFERGRPETLEEGEYYEIQLQTEEEYRKSVGFPEDEEYSPSTSTKRSRIDLFGGGHSSEFRYARLVKRRQSEKELTTFRVMDEFEQKRKIEMEYGIKLIPIWPIFEEAKAHGRYKPSRLDSEIVPIAGFCRAPSSNKEKPSIELERFESPAPPVMSSYKTPEKRLSGRTADEEGLPAHLFDVFRVQRHKKGSWRRNSSSGAEEE